MNIFKRTQLKDIPDYIILATHKRYHQDVKDKMDKWMKDNNKDDTVANRIRASFNGFLQSDYPEDVLHKEYGWPVKLINKKQEQLVDKNHLEYGVSISGSWLTEQGEQYLKELESNG